MLKGACCKYSTQNVVKKSLSGLGTVAQLCRAISSQLRHISTIGKKLLSSNISSTCSHNMVNFGPLAAEICPVPWGTSANFNGFRVLARHPSIGRQPNFAALNKGRHLYSAGRPSRWTFAHILVFLLLIFLILLPLLPPFHKSSYEIPRQRYILCKVLFHAAVYKLARHTNSYETRHFVSENA